MVDGSNPSTPTTISKLNHPSLPPPNTPTSHFDVNVWQHFGNALCHLNDHPLAKIALVELFCQLQAFQAQKRFSDAETAAAIGISKTYFARLKNGERPLTLPVVNKIYRALVAENLPLNVFPTFYERLSMGKNNISLQQATEQFLIAKQVESRTPDTIEFYSGNLGRIAWFFHENRFPVSVRHTETKHLRALLAYVQTSTNRWDIGSASSRHPASPATIDAYWRTLQSFFAWLVREEIIKPDKNPMLRIPRPKVPEKVVQDIPPALFREALALFDPETLLGLRNRALVLFLVDSGCRLNEITYLTFDNLNLAEGTAYVLGKGQKWRTIAFGSATTRAINQNLLPWLNWSLCQKILQGDDSRCRYGRCLFERHTGRFQP